MQFPRMFCPLAIPLRATVTNNPPAGKRLLLFARRMKHLYPGLTARERCLKKHLNNHKPQRSFILFCSLPLLEEVFLLPLQLWLQAHTQSHIRSKGEISSRNWSDFPLCQYRACVTIWRAKSGACWGLKTNLVAFLASSWSKRGSMSWWLQLHQVSWGRDRDGHLCPPSLFKHSRHLNTPRNDSLKLLMQGNLNPLILEICIEYHELDLTSNKML